MIESSDESSILKQRQDTVASGSYTQVTTVSSFYGIDLKTRPSCHATCPRRSWNRNYLRFQVGDVGSVRNNASGISGNGRLERRDISEILKIEINERHVLVTIFPQIMFLPIDGAGLTVEKDLCIVTELHVAVEQCSVGDGVVVNVFEFQSEISILEVSTEQISGECLGQS